MTRQSANWQLINDALVISPVLNRLASIGFLFPNPTHSDTHRPIGLTSIHSYLSENCQSGTARSHNP
ncbi:MAG: hypothetical protein AAF959_05025 [Cyanobacteria bacterium P01_D01_bin.56]